MRAWVVERPGPIDGGPLADVDLPDPEPAPGEVRLQVTACGVCRTDLHLAEGDLAPRRPRTVPGHEIVGIVDARGLGAQRFELGERVGVAWLRSTCGRCRWCRSGAENLCPQARFTGWDADGGYAERAVVPEAYAYRLPKALDDAHAAPLLCSGIVGYRALRRASLPPGGRLGLYGFGGSAHVVLQVAVAQGATVHVLTRSQAAQRLALSLGAASVAGAFDQPPEPLDAAICFAPVGTLVPVALRALDRGGVLVVAGIHLTDVPPLVYERELFYEKQVRSVTANTRADGDELLRLAANLSLLPHVVERSLSQAQATLADLAADAYAGAAVLVPGLDRAGPPG
ncbi:zinc-dependent alcohol dehydrogenase family protein [Angustibacter sp. Root456]|uniref:zinc-dependent alcohol dehydrogenase family protein n=1 Tax=Angustibacter sp. Root456 TaxID=1736539 RepID=UPI000700EE4E|nr:zinc-dependent alcohol dehydrogenase family protein [Angustibacter sp. Root456]KQX62102.1 alcohol dehydrogenase [Angustibacter sp. Root456]